ncbi:MAG: heparinase II/III family protein [Candidatus Hydrogenedentota bacterium]
MYTLIRIVVLTALLATPAAAADIDAGELGARLADVDPAHPRLFFAEAETEALKAKIASDPLLEGAFDYLAANAEIVKTLAPSTRKQVGKRLLGVSRRVLQRVSYLAFVYRMTGDEALLRRAEAEMLAAADFEDWNPSHFLDVAEMTAALAIGYDWLYNDLAPESRATIRDAIVEKGLETSLEGGGWVTTTNNWNQVCHGGLTLGALAVVEDEPDLAETVIARGLKNLPRAMHEYEPDGVYPEGASYWQYGTTYNVLFIAALESVLGTDFGITSAQGLMKSPEFMLHVTGPTGKYFNFSDCGSGSGSAPALHWFARRLDRPAFLWHEQEALAELATKEPNSKGSGNRLLPFLLIWGMPTAAVPTPETRHWQGDGPTPVAMHRSAWQEDATYVGVKGGSPHTNHAHMDIGTFVIDMQGVRWAIDLGAQSYHSLESKGIALWDRSSRESERWTVFRLNNFSHNTLVVNDELQRVRADARISAFSGAPSHPHTIIDMSPVYEGQLTKAIRGVHLDGETVLIQDEIAAPEDAEADVRWGMVTKAAVTLEEGTATLEQAGKTATLRVLAPGGVTLDVLDLEDPPRSYDAKNPNTRMVAFNVTLPAAGKETLAVCVTPGETPDEWPSVHPLADWLPNPLPSQR